MAGKENLKPFKKGDPRINRKGRPKNFDALRELTQSLAHGLAMGKDGPIVTDGHLVTVTEAILRQWASSKNPKLQQAFLEYAYGKPSIAIEHSGRINVSQLSDDELAAIVSGQGGG